MYRLKGDDMKPKRFPRASTSMIVDPLKLTVAVVALLLFPTLLFAQLRTAVIDSAGDVGKYSSIVIDSNKHLHISYYDATNRALKYAMIDNAGRFIEVVDSTANVDVGRYSAIAVDGANVPHISYYDATNKDLKYAVKRGSGWTIQTVDSAGNVGMHTSIAVDQLGNPWISYYNEGSEYLKLAYWDGGWQIKQCCPVRLTSGTSESGKSTAIQLEHMSSYPLVLFFDVTDRTLKLAIFDRTRNQWGVEVLRSANFIFQDLSLTLDTANQPHVSFSEVSATGESVWYGKKTCAASGCLTQVTPTQPTGEGTWNFETVDATAATFASLALDATNLPWATYYDLAYGLRLAQKSGTGWSVQTVDPGWEVGLYNAIALDTNNRPHISYYDQANGDLKYASTSLPQGLDVWIKDCPKDNGRVPSTPVCTEWSSSPDIWFAGRFVPGFRNTLKAQVRNRSFSSARNVTVRFYLADQRPSLTGDIYNAATLIGERPVTVAPNSSVTASVAWTPPLRMSKRFWIGVVLDHPDDPPHTGASASPPKDNNIAVNHFGP